MQSVSIDMPLLWSGESRPGDRSYNYKGRLVGGSYLARRMIHIGDFYGNSIVQDSLSPSLSAQLILFGHLITRYSLL